MNALVEDPGKRKPCAEFLLQMGCCLRCTLRYLGQESEKLYSMPSKDILKNLNIDDETLGNEDGNGPVCIACLGILQDKYSGVTFCAEIEKVIKDNDSEFMDYYIALSTPVSLLLRDHSIWISLKEEFTDIYKDSVRDRILTVKEVWRFSNSDILSSKLGHPFDTDSSFTINLNFTNSDNECRFLFDLYPAMFAKRKHIRHGCEIFNRTNVTKALDDLTSEKFKSNYSCPPRAISTPCRCNSITGTYEALFVAGRYNKYSRVLSQTEWIVDGGRKTESSIEEYIAEPLKKHIRADSMRFSSSGREDVDVKMLGNGRPFLFECINPHRVFFTQERMTQIQKEINNSTKDISVKHLQLVSKDDTTHLKEGEIDKMKCYSAVCWSKKPLSQSQLDKLNQYKDLVLQQKTPVRVLHRRPLAVREKIVHSIKAKLLNEHHFLVKLHTQAGTYIKEFVHGDFGRTTPNLCSIFDTDCDIAQLDVEAVLLDWPKAVDTEDGLSVQNQSPG